MKSKSFEIQSDKVLLYPNYPLKKLAFILTAVFIVLSLGSSGFIVSLRPEPWDFKSIAMMGFVPSALFFFLPFYFMGSKVLLIDGSAGNVVSKLLFRRKKVADFVDLHGVVLVNGNLMGTSYETYELKFKNDLYGKGLRLNGGQVSAEFKQLVIPAIQKLLERRATGCLESPAESGGEFKHFRRKGNVFRLNSRYGFLIFSLIAFAASGSFFYDSLEKSTRAGDAPYWAFCLIPAFLGFVFFSKRLDMDTHQKIITSSYLGFFKKHYDFSHFVNFKIVRHLAALGGHNGTDVIMLVAKGEKNQEVMLLRFMQNTKKVQGIVEEFRRILMVDSGTYPEFFESV